MFGLSNILYIFVILYHQAGYDNDKDGEEEDDSVETFSVPHVIPLLALQDVLLQRNKKNNFMNFQHLRN